VDYHGSRMTDHGGRVASLAGDVDVGWKAHKP
jgi:hypothetical protein